MTLMNIPMLHKVQEYLDLLLQMNNVTYTEQFAIEEELTWSIQTHLWMPTNIRTLLD